MKINIMNKMMSDDSRNSCKENYKIELIENGSKIVVDVLIDSCSAPRFTVLEESGEKIEIDQDVKDEIIEVIDQL